MPLLPREVFLIDSPLAPEGVSAVLAEHVEMRVLMRGGTKRYEFEGEVGPSTFRIQRLIGYQNTLLPVVRGAVEPMAQGSQVQVTMTLPLGVIVLLALIVGGAIWLGAFVSIEMWSSGEFTPFVLLPVGIIVLVWAFSWGAFAVEAQNAKSLLVKILGPVRRPPRR